VAPGHLCRWVPFLLSSSRAKRDFIASIFDGRFSPDEPFAGHQHVGTPFCGASIVGRYYFLPPPRSSPGPALACAARSSMSLGPFVAFGLRATRDFIAPILAGRFSARRAHSQPSNPKMDEFLSNHDDESRKTSQIRPYGPRKSGLKVPLLVYANGNQRPGPRANSKFKLTGKRLRRQIGLLRWRKLSRRVNPPAPTLVQGPGRQVPRAASIPKLAYPCSGHREELPNRLHDWVGALGNL
jgi:hypothetical protein